MELVLEFLTSIRRRGSARDDRVANLVIPGGNALTSLAESFLQLGLSLANSLLRDLA